MKKLIIIAFAVSTAFLYGCESFDWFRTDKGLRKQIQGDWKREFFTTSDFEEDWNFNDGTIIITRLKNGIHDTIDEGSFSVDGKMTVSYLTISGLDADSSIVQYNNKWTIVQLDSKILDLATDYRNGGGVLQREFARK